MHTKVLFTGAVAMAAVEYAVFGELLDHRIECTRPQQPSSRRPLRFWSGVLPDHDAALNGLSELRAAGTE